MIFMNFLARSSRATGPKMRVPIGSFSLVMSTAELPSKRMKLPSARGSSFEVRTMTARATSPFFTLAPGIASRTETMMMSPIDA
jgi:hypothetical protein